MFQSDFTIWLLFEVILCGLIIPLIITVIYQKSIQHRTQKRKEKGLDEFAKQQELFKEQTPDYHPTCCNTLLHPDYFRNNVKNPVFVIQFPESKREALIEHGFCPVKDNNDDMKSNETGEKIYEHLKKLIRINGIKEEKVESFIKEIAEQTADKFVIDIKKGGVRFNKYLYGVHDICDHPQDKECVINVYESDYFTFKTVTNIYNALKEHNKGQVLIDGEDFRPFLNSFGVGGFVIVNRGKGDELVWGFRGPNCQSGGFWHFSYDETFTRDDTKNHDQNADYKSCVERALDEELGFNPEDLKTCCPASQIVLLDGGIIRTADRYEFELCSFVRICFSDEYTLDDLIQNYRFAKDAELETRCLQLVKISELDAFLDNPENAFSPEAKSLARKIQFLYNHGALASDYEGTQEIKKQQRRVEE